MKITLPAVAIAFARSAALGLLLAVPITTLAATGLVRTGADELHISNAWTRATLPGTDSGAAYFTLTNRGKQPDALISIASPAAAAIELHRTTVEKGISRMRPAGEVVIAPGQSMKVEPGQLHVMLKGLAQPLLAGTQVPLRLTFRHAGTLTVQMTVQPATFVSHDEHTGH